jgi:hypothetical protein
MERTFTATELGKAFRASQQEAFERMLIGLISGHEVADWNSCLIHLAKRLGVEYSYIANEPQPDAGNKV